MGKDPKRGLSEQHKPWLDSNGKILSNTKLRKIGQRWTAETWEEYLKTLERSLNEQLVDDFSVILKKHRDQEVLDNFVADPDHVATERKIAWETRVRETISALPPKEFAVIQALFYDRLSSRAVARKMGISHIYVRTLRDSAIQKLRLALERRETT